MTQLSLYFGMLMLTANFSSTAREPVKPALAAIVAPPASEALTNEEKRLVELVNAERWRGGLGRLRVDPVLVRAARDHSREMAEMHYFDHTSPTPGLETGMKRYLAALGHRPNYAYLGENLFYCSVVDVNRGHIRLMGSPSHRANILNGKFTGIGVGVYTSADGQFWVTQMFLASEG